ncbi:hypothetical protein ACSBR2_002249 [Camellia fascicularis]
MDKPPSDSYLSLTGCSDLIYSASALLLSIPVWLCGQKSTPICGKCKENRWPTTGRKRRLGTTSLVGVVNAPILKRRRRNVMKNLGDQNPEEKDVVQEGDVPKKAS